MATSGRLGAKKDRILLCLLSERTVEDAAKLAKVGKRTAYRWLTEPPFIAAYHAMRAKAVDQAISRLQQASGEAVGILTSIMNDPDAPATVRVTAAVKILEMAIKGTEMAELQRRVEELETSRDEPPDETEEEAIVTTH